MGDGKSWLAVELARKSVPPWMRSKLFIDSLVAFLEDGESGFFRIGDREWLGDAGGVDA